jgi:hypothetical protein
VRDHRVGISDIDDCGKVCERTRTNATVDAERAADVNGTVDETLLYGSFPISKARLQGAIGLRRSLIDGSKNHRRMGLNYPNSSISIGHLGGVQGVQKVPRSAWVKTDAVHIHIELH